MASRVNETVQQVKAVMSVITGTQGKGEEETLTKTSTCGLWSESFATPRTPSHVPWELLTLPAASPKC